MLDRTAQFGDELCGTWSRVELEAMDDRFVAAVEAAFQAGRESPTAARSTATDRVTRSAAATAEKAIEAAWVWFLRRNRDVDVAFSEVVARCPGVGFARVRAGFEKRFAANPWVKFGG